MELDERLRTERRGHFAAAELLAAATVAGHAALGWPDAGAIAVGRAGRPGHGARWTRVAHRRRPPTRPARWSSPPPPPTSPTSWSTAGVVVRDGRHLLVGTCPRELRRRDRGGVRDEQPAGRRHRRAGHQRPGSATAPLGIRRDAALVVEDGRVAWVGPAADAPAADRRLDAGGARGAARASWTATPTWSSPATGRAEFAARMAGEPYTGGGIRTTVAATRAATDDELRANVRAAASPRRCGRAPPPSRSRAGTA